MRFSTGFSEPDLHLAQKALEDYEASPETLSIDYIYAKLDPARRRAEAKGRPFSLTVQEVRDIGKSQGWRCALTGLPFSNEGDPWSRPRSMVIDRIDSRGGYEVGNVRLVLHAINVAIGSWGPDKFAVIAQAFLARRAGGSGTVNHDFYDTEPDEEVITC